MPLTSIQQNMQQNTSTNTYGGHSLISGAHHIKAILASVGQ